jgi:hypothetical protein
MISSFVRRTAHIYVKRRDQSFGAPTAGQEVSLIAATDRFTVKDNLTSVPGTQLSRTKASIVAHERNSHHPFKAFADFAQALMVQSHVTS